MNESVIIVSSQIDAAFLEKFLFVIKEKIADDCTKIHMLIQSKGGSVPIALAIGRLLNNLSVPAITYNMGNVDSAAVMIFAGGQKRFCFPQSSFGLHPLAQEVVGVKTSEDLKIILDEIETDTSRVVGFLAEQSMISSNEWRKRMNAQQRLSAEGAVEIGLATSILTEYPKIVKRCWDII